MSADENDDDDEQHPHPSSTTAPPPTTVVLPVGDDAEDDGRRIVVESAFRAVSDLIRDSSSSSSSSSSHGEEDAAVSDSVRLRLYGYYKVATSPPSSNDGHPSGRSRPSIFDPVGRAKYDAWSRCHEECRGGGDGGKGDGDDDGDDDDERKFAAMKMYVEAAASQTQNAAGRRCEEIRRGMVRDLERGAKRSGGSGDAAAAVAAVAAGGEKKKEEEESGEDRGEDDPSEIDEDDALAGAGGGGGGGGRNSPPSATGARDGDRLRATATAAAGRRPPRDPTPSPPSSWLESFLPPPLLPRGQLDISLVYLLYTLVQCLRHLLYAFLVGHRGGVLRRTLSFFVPNFVAALFDVALSRHHPRQIGRFHEGAIEGRWLDTMEKKGDGEAEADSAQVVVGLSVRSLLDLYLTARSLPAGERREVLIAPPVNVPGMVDVLEHHGLVVVPVDLPAKDAGRGGGSRWGVDPDAVRAAITDRTAAVLVVHPFGAVIADSKTMRELREMVADGSGGMAEVWEDCAQCYSGSPMPATGSLSSLSGSKGATEGATIGLGYGGSEHADLSLFSFGPIKTATALGGGIAVLRDASAASHGRKVTKAVDQGDERDGDDRGFGGAHRARDTAVTMRRIQDTTYGEQSQLTYLTRVLKCLVVHAASRSRLACGLARAAAGKLGADYDEFVVSLTRGFLVTGTPPGGVGGDGKKDDRGEGRAREDDARRGRLIRQLRRRPCAAMLALLHKRLLDSEGTCARAARRLGRCRAFAARLRGAGGADVLVPRTAADGFAHGWLFPVMLPNGVDPRGAAEALARRGYDAPRGATQLGPVGDADGCPRTRAAFDRILYLPVANPDFTNEDGAALIRALGDVASTAPRDNGDRGDRDEDGNDRILARGGRRKLGWTTAMFFICLFEWYFCFVGLFRVIPLRFTFRMTILLAPWVGAAAGLAIISLLLLSWHMGPIYLNSSNTFAKYCNMVLRSPFQDACAKGDDDNAFSQSKTVLELASTKVPIVGVPAESAHNDASEPQRVLLTGATGFIGSLLLRELLLHRRSLSIPGGVVVMVRSKRSKSARERVDRLLLQPMFDFLSDVERRTLVLAVEADVALPNCGMQEEQFESLCRSNVSHVFHCAAAVSFSQSLEDAAVSNITSSLQMYLLTKKLRRQDAKFVYISTAFVHGGNTGTRSQPLSEDLFSLRPYDSAELYKSMLGSQSYASAAMIELGFPNTYTFSKCVCEHLLLRANEGVETIIIRPSIVGPSVQEPFEGWAGEKPSTIVAAACLYLKFPYNMWCFGKETVPFVPVDVVCRFVISRSFQQAALPHVHSTVGCFVEAGEEKKETSPSDALDASHVPCTIATVAWDASSPSSSSFSWIAYAFTITHLGAVFGHVNRVIAYVGLLLSTSLFPQCDFSLDTFQRLHSMFVKGPLDATLDLWGRLPWKPRIFRDLKSLSPVIDLPMLFFPYANQSFYFKSNLVAPSDFNGERYMFCCVVAAHRFIQMIENRRKRSSSDQLQQSNLREYSMETTGRKDPCHNSSIVIAGAHHMRPTSDLWWALTQPKGNLTIRFGGWILAKIFRHTAMEIEVDVASFDALARAASSTSTTNSPHIIIAPTHRSFYDFLIVSYICFSLPELGFDMPHIAAASEFASIPLIGWLAKRSGAFFLKRGEEKKDDNLKKSLVRMKEGTQSPTFIEVFIEGKRSRTRTFIKPRTGFLRCLAETSGRHIVLPLTINYEGIPEQSSLIYEANYGAGEEMSLAKLVNWFCCVFAGSVNIGRVYVSASEVMAIPNSNNKSIIELAHTIQSLHQSRVMVSGFHIQAASLALDLDEKVISEALLELGCQFWPELYKTRKFPRTPDDRDFLWAAMLQFGHLFGPFLAASHPMWSSWLLPTFNSLDAKSSSNRAVNIFLSKLIQHFELAEETLDGVFANLQSKGFHAPEENHIVQYLPADAGAPVFLMQVAVKAKVAALRDSNANKRYPRCMENAASCRVRPRFSYQVAGAHHGQLHHNPNNEAFGAWGYEDSHFVLNVNPDGSKHVMMKGARYSISGKPLTRLANFVEEELKVVIDPKGPTFLACETLHNIPESDLASECVAKIVILLGGDDNRLSLRMVDRARHGTGHSQEDMYDLRTGLIRSRLPDAVVWPRSEGEIQALVTLAAQNNWCLIPFGGGTNVTHSTHCPSRVIDPRLMISVDMKLMSRVLWVNEEDGLAHVEAGITGIELFRYMEKLGYTAGHEPDSFEFSTVGGWIATKASGMKQNKYGNIEDIVREVNVVGAQGLMSHKHKTEKSSVGRSSIGVDVKSLVLGSEGCFGIIVSAVIKIWPLAESKSHGSVLLPNFEVGLKFVKDLSKMRAMKPASVRLLDNGQFRLGQALKETPSRFESLRNLASKNIGFYIGNFSDRLVVCATITFEGTANEVKTQKSSVQEVAYMHGGILAGSKVGKAGYDLTFAIAYIRDFALSYNILGESFETFVPWSRLTQVVESTKKKIFSEHKRRALPGVPFVCCRITQLYDEGACVYFYFCMQVGGVAEPSRTFSAIERSARQEILDNGGSLSHHHGLGKLRSPFVEQIYSQGHVDSIIAVKEALDPTNTFGARNGLLSTTHCT